MPLWGDSNNANHSSNLPLGDTFRLMGGASPNVDGMTLASVSIEAAGNGVAASLRLAVYQGGSSSSPIGATLVEDLGTITVGSADARQYYTKTSATNPALTKNVPTWIAAKQGTQGAVFFWSTSSGDAGDFYTAVGRVDVSGATNGVNPAVGFPSTLDGTAGSNSGVFYAWYLDYNVGGSGPTPAQRARYRKLCKLTK